MTKRNDEHLPGGSVIYWSQRFQDGRYPSGGVRWCVPVRCGWCGEVREVSTSVARNSKFTGLCPSCANQSSKHERTSKRILKTCLQCGRTFRVPPSLSGRKFCSNECYWASMRTLNARCLYCGKHFHRSPSELKRGGPNTYCSRECYEQARQERVTAKHKHGYVPGGRGGDVKVHCANCGKPIYLRPSNVKAVKNHYCSRKCMREHRTLPVSQLTPGRAAYRGHLVQERGRCELCGLAEPDILVVHHKDGNRSNNAKENLAVLCPNCHARIHREGITPFEIKGEEK